MIRTAIVTLALVVAVLYLPLWLQLALFVVAVFVVSHRLALFIPAIVADALYAPTASFGLHSVAMTALVAVLLALRWALIHKTRFGTMLYGLET